MISDFWWLLLAIGATAIIIPIEFALLDRFLAMLEKRRLSKIYKTRDAAEREKRKL